MKIFIYWLPRIFAIFLVTIETALITFFTLFIIGVRLHGSTNTGEILLVALIPSFLLIGALIIAWKKELIGALLFIVLGIFEMWYTIGQKNFDDYYWFIIPKFILSFLFVFQYFYMKYNSKKLNSEMPETEI